jgi:hypothetical protein
MQMCLSTSTMPSARLKEAPVGQTSTQGGSAQCWHIIGSDCVLPVRISLISILRIHCESVGRCRLTGRFRCCRRSRSRCSRWRTCCCRSACPSEPCCWRRRWCCPGLPGRSRSGVPRCNQDAGQAGRGHAQKTAATGLWFRFADLLVWSGFMAWPVARSPRIAGVSGVGFATLSLVASSVLAGMALKAVDLDRSIAVAALAKIGVATGVHTVGPCWRGSRCRPSSCTCRCACLHARCRLAGV